MKFKLLILSATVFAGACNSHSKTAETAVPVAPATIVAERKAPVHDAATDNNTVTSSGTIASESDNTAKAKTGWSKTAKGAVIGGVVGAGTGAIINKRNRAVGAVVGGVAGAGAGAVIGNELDKKDGRH